MLCNVSWDMSLHIIPIRAGNLKFKTDQTHTTVILAGIKFKKDLPTKRLLHESQIFDSNLLSAAEAFFNSRL